MAGWTKLQNVDEKSRKVVFGYFHEYEKEQDLADWMIPVGIINLCLLFYWLNEQWNDNLHEKNIKLSNDKQIAMQIEKDNRSNWWQTVFATIIIDKQNYPQSILNGH